MHGYICFYKGRQVEVLADTPSDAQDKVAAMFKVKPKWRYTISVHLAELNVGTAKAESAVQSVS